MKILLFLALVLTQWLNAQVLSASYEVSFGVFQKMGVADARLEVKPDQSYVIHIDARTTGMAKVLSNGRAEMYESRGKLQNGKYVPQQFVTIRQTNSKKTIKTYTFDHANKTVWKEVLKNGVRSPKEQNEFYASEDILSLFFNIKSYAKTKQNRSFSAISGNNKQGKIDVIFPKNGELAGIQKTLGMDEGDFLKVVLNDKIFSSANGELLINLDNEGLCEKAILEDVLLFGDIVGQRVK